MATELMRRTATNVLVGQTAGMPTTNPTIPRATNTEGGGFEGVALRETVTPLCRPTIGNTVSASSSWPYRISNKPETESQYTNAINMINRIIVKCLYVPPLDMTALLPAISSR